ncbi:MAG: hypothetical protein GKS05_01115 [Nitrospirales bacterium]|nr:hypothetical protein [Nitrospirales bacterium]
MPNTRMRWLTLAIMILLTGGSYLYWQSPTPCHPNEAEAQLIALTSQGIHSVYHPPSLSNLLWIHVGPQWHALSEDEKRSLDRLVRCAARRTDEQGKATWQAAYYDQDTGKMVALTSRKWGFRLKEEETHFSQDLIAP